MVDCTACIRSRANNVDKEFGWKNRHLARTPEGGNRTNLNAAWFVSHCATVARREKYVKSKVNSF